LLPRVRNALSTSLSIDTPRCRFMVLERTYTEKWTQDRLMGIDSDHILHSGSMKCYWKQKLS